MIHKNKRRLVKIKGVLAPNYVLSLYKHRLSGEDVTFKEFSKAANFTIFLPVTTLAPTLPRAVAENEDDDHDREEIVIVDNIDDGDNGKGDNDNNNSGALDGFDGVFVDNAGEEEDKEEEGEKMEEEKEEDGDDAIRPAVDEGTSAAAAAFANLMLGPLPDANDSASFSTVLDDVFHFEDRVKMSMHHPSKKDYFVALRNAVMIEDENDMKKVVAALKKVGLSDEQIKQRKKFNFKWFSSRVKRYVPEPKILYERVRAVYAAFGDRKDSTKADSKPLFTKTAWKKARKNLDNIKKGYVSDPPDVNRYFHKLNNKGGT